MKKTTNPKKANKSQKLKTKRKICKIRDELLKTEKQKPHKQKR